jgi:hypothetical protein
MKSYCFVDDDSSAAPKGVEVVVESGPPPVKQYSLVTFEDRVFPLGSCRNGISIDMFLAASSPFPVLAVDVFNVFRNASHCINDIVGNPAGHLCIVDHDTDRDILSVCDIASKMKLFFASARQREVPPARWLRPARRRG